MKVVSLLLLVVGLAVAQHFRTPKHSFSIPSTQQTHFNTFHGSQGQTSNRDRHVHATDNGRQYHFSWKADSQRVFKGEQALSYCRGLGDRWYAVGIGSKGEWNYIKKLLGSIPLRYFWVGGSKRSGRWTWATGENFGSFTAWSHDGGDEKPQPDNRDPPENCLGVLKGVYQDGITWHDINCKHEKHVVCEKV